MQHSSTTLFCTDSRHYLSNFSERWVLAWSVVLDGEGTNLKAHCRSVWLSDSRRWQRDGSLTGGGRETALWHAAADIWPCQQIDVRKFWTVMDMPYWQYTNSIIAHDQIPSITISIFLVIAASSNTRHLKGLQLFFSSMLFIFFMFPVLCEFEHIMSCHWKTGCRKRRHPMKI